MASNNTSKRLTPAERDENARIRDLHKPGPEHALPVAPRTRVVDYDDNFLNPQKAGGPEIRAYSEDFFNPEKTRTSAIQQIVGETGGQTEEALKYDYFVPRRFEKGKHLSRAVVEGRLLGLSLISNETFTDLKPGQAADIGVATTRFSPDRVEATLMDFHIGSSDDRTKVIDLLNKARREKLSIKSVVDEEQKSGQHKNTITQLKLTLDLKAKRLDTSSLGEGSKCYLLRGKNISDVTSVGNVDLKRDDIVFAATERLIAALVKNVSREKVEQPLAGKLSKQEGAGFDFKKDYEEIEAASQVKGMLEDATTVGKNIKIDKLLLSPTDLHNSLSEIYDKRMKEDPKKRIVTDAFFVYQIP